MGLSGNNISLRPIERSDLGNLNKWKNDEDIYKYLGGGYHPVSMDIQEKWLDSLMDTTGNNRRFIIEKRNEAIGMIGLYNISWVHRICELGIFVGEKAEQGKGYASEAYYLIEEYAKNYLNIRKIKANVVSCNTGAVAMYRKLGFCQSGCLKDERYIDGQYHDLLVMEKFLG